MGSNFYTFPFPPQNFDSNLDSGVYRCYIENEAGNTELQDAESLYLVAGREYYVPSIYRGHI